MRVLSFRILTEFDEIPPFVTPFKIVRQASLVPQFCMSFTNEIAVRYTQEYFEDLFSIGNVCAGLFRACNVYFDIGVQRYQIVMEAVRDPCQDFVFWVVQLLEPIALERVKKRPGQVKTRSVVGPVGYWEITASSDSLRFGETVIGPVLHISLLALLMRGPKPSQGRASRLDRYDGFG
jgi:hypothetical protein